MDFFSILWLFIIIASIQPILRQRYLEAMRQRVIYSIERKRGSRVITMLHRQETMSFLGFPVTRYIDIEDSEQVLRAIRLTPDDMPIDLILHTPGGLVLAAEQIAHALVRHKGKVTVFVPHYAMSGGTLIALAADEIVMDENAVLGPVDPQLGQAAAASILRVLEMKDVNEIDDQTLIMADLAQKALRQVRNTVQEVLIANGMDSAKAEKIADVLSSGTWTHDYPISCEEARALGLPVSTEMLPEVYTLMDLYPQPTQRRPSVQYIPLPYERREDGGRPRRGGGL
ncbi:MAG: ATP-dependent Clp protease proteolytic subunit [Anaerolineae bacterium]|nr:ATP-dependent Clp protease proteolytic subunit [Anaerolineae bacterium]MDW8098756.1 ATP-dependent Clp protease proteolytic subunit [Anaerolineae bacterium]